MVISESLHGYLSFYDFGLQRKICYKNEVLVFSVLDEEKRDMSMPKGLLKVTAVVAFTTPLKSSKVWQMHMAWNVYTCPVSINRDKQHISSANCEQNSC